MKATANNMVIVVMLMAMSTLSGCGLTMTKADRLQEASVDLSTSAVDAGAGIAKKAIQAGFSVYDLVKAMFEDSKDNFEIVKQQVKSLF